MSVRERLSALGIEIPPPAEPKGAYFPSRLVGDQLWISGTTSRRPTEPGAFGTVGEDVTPEQAQKHAGYAALNLIAAVTRPSVSRRYAGSSICAAMCARRRISTATPP